MDLWLSIISLILVVYLIFLLVSYSKSDKTLVEMMPKVPLQRQQKELRTLSHTKLTPDFKN